MKRYWLVAHFEGRFHDKSAARELTRATGAGVFWERTVYPDGTETERPIFVGPRPSPVMKPAGRFPERILQSN